MKPILVHVIAAATIAAFTSTAMAAKAVVPVMEEIDPNLMEEFDPNALPESAAGDTTIVDPKTVGKPRPKTKLGKKAPKDIPLIETEHEGKSSDDVTYVTGGVGKDERDAIEAGKADYNLYISSAAVSGEFVGDTRVVITRVAGDESEEVLNVDAGPLLYVRLPAGTYTLVATLGEQTKEQKLVVHAQGKPSTVRLSWKSVE